MEAVLGYLKGSEVKTSTLGRSRPSMPPSLDAARMRAAAVTRSLNDSPLRLATQPVQATHSPLRNAARGTSAPTGNTAGGASNDETGLNISLTRIVDGLRQSPSPSSSAPTSPAHAHGPHHQAEGSPGWRGPRGVSPVGRGEAVVLEAALDEALPAGGGLGF